MFNEDFYLPLYLPLWDQTQQNLPSHGNLSAGIFKQSRNLVGIGLSYRPARLHRLAESIPWNASMTSVTTKKMGMVELPSYPSKRADPWPPWLPWAGAVLKGTQEWEFFWLHCKKCRRTFFRIPSWCWKNTISLMKFFFCPPMCFFFYPANEQGHSLSLSKKFDSDKELLYPIFSLSKKFDSDGRTHWLNDLLLILKNCI